MRSHDDVSPRRALPLALAFALATAGACLPGAGFAQQAPAATPAPPGVSACVAIEIDAARLACYDAAAGRAAPSTRQADAAAEAAQAAADAARAEREAKEPRPVASDRAQARRQRGNASLFRRDAPGAPEAEPLDPEAQAAIANAGKGSLLDTRWELARDSKLGIFNFRAYKPV
jgi:phospholipase A1